jgi:hypothetical protein
MITFITIVYVSGWLGCMGAYRNDRDWLLDSFASLFWPVILIAAIVRKMIED